MLSCFPCTPSVQLPLLRRNRLLPPNLSRHTLLLTSQWPERSHLPFPLLTRNRTFHLETPNLHHLLSTPSPAEHPPNPHLPDRICRRPLLASRILLLLHHHYRQLMRPTSLEILVCEASPSPATRRSAARSRRRPSSPTPPTRPRRRLLPPRMRTISRIAPS
jgi:hypothetical protein